MTKALSTRAVRAGINCDTAFGSIVPPLVLSANFSFDGFDGKRRYDYTRSRNPTRDQLGDALASLEGGAAAVVTATGMAAVSLILHALLEPGNRLLVPPDCYGGGGRVFSAPPPKGGVRLERCQFTDGFAGDGAIGRQPDVGLVVEPANPLVRLTRLCPT